MFLTEFFVSEFWIFWICLYISYQFIIKATYGSNVPLPVTEILDVPKLPALFAYDSVEIYGKFIFNREEEAGPFEKCLEELQMWIYLNRFRPLSCLKDNKTIPFFQQQTIKSVSKKILIELFSVDRDTRLKELLRYLCYNIDEDDVRLTAGAIVVLISTYLGIKIMVDGKNAFEKVPLVLFRALCSSRNLFFCDFMLHHLSTSANADEIISKYDLNALLRIDTSTEDTNLAKILNQTFMKPIERKKPGFPKLFGNNNGENNLQFDKFKRYAENVLKDIRLFQTILTNLPEKNDDGDDDDDDGNNSKSNDDNDDYEEELDKRIKERFDKIKRMAGYSLIEEEKLAAPIQTEYENIPKEERKNAPMILFPKSHGSVYSDNLDEEQDISDEELDTRDEDQDTGDEEEYEQEKTEERKRRKMQLTPEKYRPVLSRTEEVSSFQENTFEAYDHNIARAERRLSWPLVKSGSKVLLRLVDDAGSAIVDESKLMRILRHHLAELMENLGFPISEVVVSSLYHNNASIRDFAYAIIFSIPPGTAPISPPTPPVRYRSNSVYDQITFDKYGYPPDPVYPPPRSDEDVSDIDNLTSSLSSHEESELDQDIPSPVSEASDHTETSNNDNGYQDKSNVAENTESGWDQVVPFVINPDFTPSPESEASDRTETSNRGNTQDESNDYANTDSELDRDEPVSEVSGDIEFASATSGGYFSDDEAEPNAGKFPSDTVYIISNSVSENAELFSSNPDSSLDTQVEIDHTSENVDYWMRNFLDKDIPIVADNDEEEERRWEFLGFDENDREGFSHFFFNFLQATFFDVNELRKKMNLINGAFRNLTSNQYVGLLNRQVLSGNMLPESINIIEELQMAYNEMICQYINYQRLFEEFEVGYTILKTIDIVECYRHDIGVFLLKLEEESTKKESTLRLSVFESVYKTVCDGSQMIADLKRTWNTYVESSSSFKKVQKTYQKYINDIEQDFIIIVNDFYIIYDTYLMTKTI